MSDLTSSSSAAPRVPSQSRVRALLRACVVVAGVAVVAPGWAAAQTVYRLHQEGSPTGPKSLRTAAMETATVTLSSAGLQSVASGTNVIIRDFITENGVPGVAGTWSTSSVFTATLFLRKSANFRVLYPRIEVRLNGSTGALVCAAVDTAVNGGGGITTSTSTYTVSCSPSGQITVTASARLYLWVSTQVSGATDPNNLTAELITEGANDARLQMPVLAPPPPTRKPDEPIFYLQSSIRSVSVCASVPPNSIESLVDATVPLRGARARQPVVPSCE